MLRLTEINFKEFKKEIYPKYVKLFPKNERKSLYYIKKPYLKGITKLVKIVDDDTTVGFLIYNTLPNNKYVQLDYFAIYKQFQNKKYGSKAIKLFKEFFHDYNGIYGEVEKIGLGKNEEENKIREKRIKFWESLGFQLFDFDLELFKVIYSPCILKTKEFELDEDEVMKSAFEIYNALLGEKNVSKNCKVLIDSYIK